jgi:hypothetical protein
MNQALMAFYSVVQHTSDFMFIATNGIYGDGTSNSDSARSSNSLDGTNKFASAPVIRTSAVPQNRS